jgi:hypothetical protein
MVIVDGEIVARQAGAAPAPVLRSWLEKALSPAPPDAPGRAKRHHDS